MLGYPFPERTAWWWYPALWGLVAGGLAVGAIVGLAVALATAAVVTLPPTSRADQLCMALGTEAPCDTEEVGHLRGTLTFVADDARSFMGVLATRGKSLAADLGIVDEATLLLRLTTPSTNWEGLVTPSSAWPALRAVAQVTDGVPVLMALTYKRGGVDQTDQVAPTTALARVRIALVGLR